MTSSVLAQSAAGVGGGGGGGSSGGAVTITGTLPAFAQTPTFNIGTIAGIATETGVQQVRTALGSPFQAGGSIGNAAFGISGTLPAFAATPTVNLGTIGGVATAANQASEISALGAAGDAAYAGSGSASIVSALKGLYSLTAATPRVVAFADASQVSLASGATAGNIGRDPGSNGPYTRFNATFYSSQAGTVQILGSDDAINFYPMANQSYTAATVVTYTVPITFRYYYAKLINGGTAATGVTIKSSFTAN
jgi:hypothetical protein